jgi:hypothetical protein
MFATRGGAGDFRLPPAKVAIAGVSDKSAGAQNAANHGVFPKLTANQSNAFNRQPR